MSTTNIERVFDSWVSDDAYPTLFRVDRAVTVDIAKVFPAMGQQRDRRLWITANGLHLEPQMRARQIAWIRRDNGGWLALVMLPAMSGNGQSRIVMPLWVDPSVITPDEPGDLA